MASVNNVPKEIQDSMRDVLGQKVKFYIKRMVKQEIRPDKWEKRVIGLTGCRFFIFAAKAPTRIEQNFSFLEIQAIESKKTNQGDGEGCWGTLTDDTLPRQFLITVEGKSLTFVTLEAETDEVNHVITHIGTSLKNVFPAFPLERLIKKIEVQPSSRLKTMNEMIKGIETKEVGPCGGFSMMYACMCDFHNLQYREEVAWDVDTIYLSQDTRELCLRDFDHLNSKDLVPIIAALEHNTWFTKLNASNVKLSFEAQSEMLKVIKRNAVLEELCLSNTGISVDFVTKLATALLSNSATQLSRVDLSRNTLDDKAVIHFLGSLGNLSKGLVHFDISHTKIMGKGLNKVAEVLSQHPNISINLQSLNLSENGSKGEDLQHLYSFLAKPNTITDLNLSGTDCALEQLCGALLRSSLGTLVHLRLGRNVYSHKKTKEVVVQGTWKTFFSSILGLETLDLSGCRIPPEALKELLLGIASNIHLKSIHLDLSGNDLQAPGAQVLGGCIGNINSITSLDVSNNGLDQSLVSLLDWIKGSKSIRHLAIGQNFDHIKPKNIPMVMESIVNLIQDEEMCIESFSLADSKLKNHLADIINALGSNMTLTQIDIGGNHVGDLGARMLSKALQINTKLRTIMWDKNNTTAQGFEDIAEALQKNFTLKKMPTPIHDASSALQKHPERTGTALQKIETLLQRNHSPQKYSSDQAYRLQQGFLISSTQQMVDRLVVQVQDTINALSIGSTDGYKLDIDKASNIIKDADNSKQLLPSLQDIAMKSVSAGNPIENKLNGIATDLKEVLQMQMKKTVEDMLSCTSSKCQSVTSEKNFMNELVGECTDRSALPKDFTKHLLDGVETDIFNKLSELNLAVAAHVSDSVIDTVIESLTCSHKDLTNHLKRKRSMEDKDKDEEKKIENEQENQQEKAEEEENEKPLMRITIPEDSPVEQSQSEDDDDATPNLSNKRKSVHARKMRPPTVIGKEPSPKPAKHKSPNAVAKSKKKKYPKQVLEARENHESKQQGDLESKPKVTNEPVKEFQSNLTEIPESASVAKPIEDGVDEKTDLNKIAELPPPLEKLELDSISDLPATTKLTHLAKSRARGPQRRRPTTRPTEPAGDAGVKADEGLDSFFETRMATTKPVTTVTTATTTPVASAGRKNSETNKKDVPVPPSKPTTEKPGKKWSPFSKAKDKGEKSEKIEKKSGFSLFSKKDASKKTERSPSLKEEKQAPEPPPASEKPLEPKIEEKVEPIEEKVEEKAEEVKAETTETENNNEEKSTPPEEQEEAPAPRPKKPIGGMGMGFGFNMNIMAEMKNRQRSSVVPGKKEAKEARKPTEALVPPPKRKPSIESNTCATSDKAPVKQNTLKTAEEESSEKKEDAVKEEPQKGEKAAADVSATAKEKSEDDKTDNKTESKEGSVQEKSEAETQKPNSGSVEEKPATESGNQSNADGGVELRDKDKKPENSAEEKASEEGKENTEGQKQRHSILQTVHAKQKPQPTPRVPNARKPSDTGDTASLSSVSSRSSVTSDDGSLKPKPSPPVRPKPPPKSKKPVSLRKSQIEALNAEGTENKDKETSPQNKEQETSSQKEESGVVVDSATLRMSVEEKIKRLSQNSDGIPANIKRKSTSLPKNTDPPSKSDENDSGSKSSISSSLRSSTDSIKESDTTEQKQEESSSEKSSESNETQNKEAEEKEKESTDAESKKSSETQEKNKSDEPEDKSSKPESAKSVEEFEVVMV